MKADKSIRICGTKVRTGCITCKTRRVKCDEAKPFCKKCTSGGRKCEGYVRVDKKHSELRMVVYQAPSKSFISSEPERQSFAYFLDQTRARFPTDFSDSVLQAAHTNQALAHSIISLGALQQLYEHGDDPHLKTGLGQLAAQQYGKALRALQNPQQPPSVDTLLICSVLFTCFECLRGSRRSAMIHMKSGLDLFRQSKTQATWNIVSENTIASLLIRLENQLLELLGMALNQDGDRPAPLAALTAYQSPGFGDNNLYDSFDGLLNHIFHEKINLALTTKGQVPWVFLGRKGQISSYIEEWHRGFLRSVSQSTRPRKQGQQKQQLSQNPETYGQDPDLLRIWYLLSKMYIAMQPSDAEEAWGQFVMDFDMIVTLSESYLNRSRQHPRKRTFTFSLGVIPALFLTSLRCRNTRIRRRALQLLSECNRKEVMWDSALAAEAARHIIEIEESSFRPSTLESGEKEPVGPRIRDVRVSFDDENGVWMELERIDV